MRTAFKEWAIVVDALGRGDQILILRKGGIREGRGGFNIEEPEFLLFPTLFHQQRESVIPVAQRRFDEIVPSLADPSRVCIKSLARVVEWKRLESRGDAERLRGQHIWRNEVIAERFDWGRDKVIHAMAVRVFRLAHTVDLPMLPSYGGCKSWIEIAEDVPMIEAKPVLDDEAFAGKLEQFRAAVGTEFARSGLQDFERD